MLTVNVVEPVVGETPEPLSRDYDWSKARMAKGGISLCNVSVPTCEAMQESLRSVIAANTADFIDSNDVWLRCENGDFKIESGRSVCLLEVVVQPVL